MDSSRCCKLPESESDLVLLAALDSALALASESELGLALGWTKANHCHRPLLELEMDSGPRHQSDQSRRSDQAWEPVLLYQASGSELRRRLNLLR